MLARRMGIACALGAAVGTIVGIGGAAPGPRERDRRLVRAVRRTEVDPARVARLIASGADLDGRDVQGRTPLMAALAIPDAAVRRRIVRLLLQPRGKGPVRGGEAVRWPTARGVTL